MEDSSLERLAELWEVKIDLYASDFSVPLAMDRFKGPIAFLLSFPVEDDMLSWTAVEQEHENNQRM